jgi:lysozyme
MGILQNIKKDYKMANYINGVDISNLQGDVDFNALAATGVQFIVARCGIGNDGIDSDYNANIAGARAAGLQVLAYHFCYPLPTIPGKENRSPQAQAQAHFNAAQGVQACCDLEWPTSDQWGQWGCTAASISQWTLEYLQTYSQLSGTPMIIYTYPYYAESLNLAAQPQFAQYPLWIASYEDSPDIPAPWNSWVLWQQTGGGGHLSNGAPVDTDVAPDLSLWGLVNQAAAAPITEPAPNPLPAPEPIPAPISTNNSGVWTSIGNAISRLFGK